jgi:hypothetical protein
LFLFFSGHARRERAWQHHINFHLDYLNVQQVQVGSSKKENIIICRNSNSTSALSMLSHPDN